MSDTAGVVLRKKINGMFDCYRFCISISNGKRCAEHHLKSPKTSYLRKLQTKFFDSAEDGNKFYKELRRQGYEIW